MKQIEKHKEVVNVLKELRTYLIEVENFKKTYNEIKSIDYSINQLELSQVFDDPIKMEVKEKVDSGFFNERTIKGKFNNRYVEERTFCDAVLWDEARPIEEKPLKFNKWYAERVRDENAVIYPDHVERLWNEHQQYVDNFNKQNK